MSRHLTDCDAAQGCALDPACEDYEFCQDALKPADPEPGITAPFLTLYARDAETRFLPGDEPRPDDEGEPGAAAGS